MQAVRIDLVETSQLAEARRAAVKIATSQGFTETEVGRVAIVATEAATNLLKHGGGGEFLVREVESTAGGGLEILTLDKGKGMTNVAESFRDGYSTCGSSGTGLGAIARQSSFVDVYSGSNNGTATLAQFWPKEPLAVRPIEIGGLSVAMRGEEECGDSWAVYHHSSGCTILVVDGLGHGPLAPDASHAAVRIFKEQANLAPGDLLRSVHAALRSSRGAAGAVTAIDTERQMVTFAGIGNIGAIVVDGITSRQAVSMNGILGHEVRSFREFTYPWSPESLLLMHSDGVAARWDLASYPGLAMRTPSLIAGILYRDFARGRDDATMVVARQGKGAA
jgi:anti-sigma regulatory factor (Ser/Thr protein kinase)